MKSIRIKSITKISQEDRYDLCVKSNENYFANGILVHNCRMIVSSKGLFSRNGKPILAAVHIFNSVKHIFNVYPDLILDSELYCDRLSNDFNKIISLAKKTKPSQEDLIESEKYLQCWVFDIPSVDLPFSGRIKKLKEVLKEINSTYLRYIDHKLVNSHEQVEKALEEYLAQGQEGVMINLPDVNYENKRSRGLMKYKNFIDDEFEIVGITEGQGNRAGMLGFFSLKTKEGDLFDSNARGDRGYYRDILKNKNSIIGRLATVRFQNYTPGNCPVPRFPVVTSVRDYE